MIALSTPYTNQQEFEAFYYPGESLRSGDGQTQTLDDLISTLEERRTVPVQARVIRGMADTALSVCLEASKHVVGSKTDLRLVETEKQTELLTGRDLLVAEWVHLGNVQKENEAEMAKMFGVSKSRVREIREHVELDISEAVDDVLAAVEATLDPYSGRMREELAVRIGAPIHDDTDPLVVAGYIIAEAAHSGQTRQNNGVSYVTHPVRGAAIYQQAWDEVACIEGREPDREHLYLQVFSILTHDALEDIIAKDGTSFLGQGEFRATPLFMRRFLERSGKSPVQVDRVVRAQRLLTKSRSPWGQSQPSLLYQEGCTETLMAMMSKFIDTTDNKQIDPKQPSGMVVDLHSTGSMGMYFSDDMLMALETGNASVVAEIVKNEKTDRERELFLRAIHERLGDHGDGVVRDYWGKQVLKRVSEIGRIGPAFKAAVPYISVGRKRSVATRIKSGDKYFNLEERPAVNIR